MLKHILEGFVMPFPKVRTTFNFDPKAWSDANGLECTDPTRTIQSQAEEANINTIVRNFGVTGTLPVGVRVPTYGDFDGASDYREAVNAIKSAEESFLAVPASLRKQLDHDPGKFVEWCADPSNLEEMRKLGLAVPGEAPVAAGEQPKA